MHYLRIQRGQNDRYQSWVARMVVMGVWAFILCTGHSGAPWVRNCGNLPIRENLVITWPYARPSVHTTGIPMLNNSINRYGNPNAINWNSEFLGIPGTLGIHFARVYANVRDQRLNQRIYLRGWGVGICSAKIRANTEIFWLKIHFRIL